MEDYLVEYLQRFRQAESLLLLQIGDLRSYRQEGDRRPSLQASLITNGGREVADSQIHRPGLLVASEGSQEGYVGCTNYGADSGSLR